MAVTLPGIGSQNWGPVVNAAMNGLDARISALYNAPSGGMKQTAAQSGWTSASASTVAFQATTHNIGNFVDLANSRLVAPIKGIYTFYGLVAFANAGTTGYIRASINLNGLAQGMFATDRNITNGLAAMTSVSWQGPLVVGDAVTLGGLQTGSASTSTTVTGYWSYLVGHFITAN